jgi:hypothetical protein
MLHIIGGIIIWFALVWVVTGITQAADLWKHRHDAPWSGK